MAFPIPRLSEQGVIRKFRPAADDQLYRHLLRLLPDDRRLRFCGRVADESVLRHCRELARFPSVVLGHFVDGRARGAGELIFDERPPWATRCELALSVEAAFQGKGIGTDLLRRLLVLARNRMTADVRFVTLAENRKMHAIARKFGARLAVRGGAVEGRIRPRPPSYVSLMEEAMLDGCALVNLALGLDEETSY